MVKQAKPAPELDAATGAREEEYDGLVGDLDKWQVDDDLSFPARSGRHTATGTQILLDLDAGQAAAVTRAAEAMGIDLVRFAKQAVLDAARAPSSYAVGEHVRRRAVTVTDE